MACNEHLAIASVPVQCWGRVYDENEAMENGTVFPVLNKPFFVTAADSNGKNSSGKPLQSLAAAGKTEQEDMLYRIQKVSFVVDDVRLYMDTHPGDGEGLALLKEMIKKRKRLLKEYALKFYPLTMDCMADIYEENPDSGCYCWQKGPVPWEGVCV